MVAGSATPWRILLVGAERVLVALARRALNSADFALLTAEGVDAALDAVFTRRPDLILVASRPDGTDGTAACRELQVVEEVPVIMLVPSADTAGAVRALTCADDYVALPVAPEELQARVRAVLRRSTDREAPREPSYDDGVLRLDLKSRTASLAEGPLLLTPTEYRLLALLAAHPRRLFPHDELLRRVWGSAYVGDSHLLRLQIANLRKKIERPEGHRYLRTHRGLGYAFEPAPPDTPRAAERRLDREP